MFERVLKAIQDYDTIIIHRHNNPDGDAMGSQVGLKHLILNNFPGKTVYMVGDAPKHYSFMEDSVMDEIPDETYRGALAVILDTSAKKLISDDRYPLECSLALTPIAAKSLYTGMVTDSGRFRFDSTTARTFRLAAFLMEQKFDTNEIYRNLYASDFAQTRLKAEYVLKIQFSPCNVAYIYTDLAEMQRRNVDTFTISRGMVGAMADIKGVDIWVNFTETEKGVLCELRSSRYNINPIAVKYGGGGHAKASGATVASREEAMAMLLDLDLLTQEEQ